MLSKLKNSPMEQRATRELEKVQNLREEIKNNIEEPQQRLQQEKLSDCNENIVKNSN